MDASSATLHAPLVETGGRTYRSSRPNAASSLFSWTHTLPRKRKAPTPRELESGRESSSIISDNTNEENIMDVSDDSTSDTSKETQGDEGDLTHEHVLKTPPRKTPKRTTT